MTDGKVNKKKTIVGLVIGIATIFIMMLGATLAYFGANTIINFNTATITYATGDKAIVILNGTSAILSLDTITGKDMAKSSKNIIYYASKTGKTTTPTEEIIGRAQVASSNDRNSYRCYFTLQLSHTGTEDIIDRFLGETNDEPDYENRSAGQIIITINGKEYDLNNGFPSTITGSVNVNAGEDGIIKAGLRFVNLTDVDQTYLINANGAININVASDGFTCENTGRSEVTYWSYDPSIGEDYVNSATANKVANYNDLTPLGYNLYVDGYGTGTPYATQVDCLNGIDGLDIKASDIRCIKSNSTYYVANVISDSYNTENDCTSAIDGQDESECIYNSTTEEWDAYVMNSETLFSTISECQTLMSTFNMTGTCVHPDFDNYYIFADDFSLGSFDTLSDCNSVLSMYAIGNNQYASNARCEATLPKVFIKEKKTTREIVSTNNTWLIYDYRDDEYDTESDCLDDLEDLLENDPPEEDITASCAINNGYTIYYDNNTDGVYSTLSECEDAMDYYESYPQYQNLRCIRSLTTDYVLAERYSSEGFSSEADCLDEIEYEDYEMCIFNNGTNKWYMYGIYTETLVPTLEDCMEVMDWWSGSGYKCVHPTAQMYYLYYDNEGGWDTYNSLGECNSELSMYPNAYNARCEEQQRYKIVSDNHLYTYYSSEQSCESQVTDWENNNSEYENPRCIANSSSDYVIRYYVDYSVDTEADCLDAVASEGDGNDECVYNSSTNKWDIYSTDKYTLKSTLADCQALIPARGYDSNTSSCVHPNFEYYYLYVDNYVDWPYSQENCEYRLNGYSEDQNASCVPINNYSIEYTSSNWQTFNNRDDCDEYIINDYHNAGNFSRGKCKPMYSEGEFVEENDYEICGIINNNLLCFSPNMSKEDYISIMEPYDFWTNHEYYTNNYEYYDFWNDDYWTEYYVNEDGYKGVYWEDYIDNIGCELFRDDIDCYTIH